MKPYLKKKKSVSIYMYFHFLNSVIQTAKRTWQHRPVVPGTREAGTGGREDHEVRDWITG